MSIFYLFILKYKKRRRQKMSQTKWENIKPTNDFMFGKIMSNKEVCHKLLEYILDIKIKDIDYPERQKSIKLSHNATGETR